MKSVNTLINEQKARSTESSKPVVSYGASRCNPTGREADIGRISCSPAAGV